MTKVKRRLLSVDWDYFFPEKSVDPHQWPLYDWGHRDSGDFFTNQIWYHRAEGFIINDLPLPKTSGSEKTFWNRFKFSPGSKLFLADSHSLIFDWSVFENVDEVWSYDAHHDAGYDKITQKEYIRRDAVTCADWVAAFKLVRGINTRVFYPKWKQWAIKMEPKPIVPVVREFDDEQPVEGQFDGIYLCRSGGWTPPWIDDEFDTFVRSCPVKRRVVLQETENREFDIVKAENMANQLQEFRRMAATITV